MIRLREIARGDLDALHALDELCFEPDIAYSRREMERYLEMAGRLGAVAEEGGHIAGYSLGARRRNGDALILTLDVHPDYRRRGVGKLLLDDLLARFRAAGAARAILQVAVENAPARAFYKKAGFRETGQLADYYDVGRDAIEMTRSLSREVA
ncbi:MAG TPA: GNAT family N-acetyltransferase [Thermoanaerobaculia bacterium]|jgi:ribosomal-protein-alanine N-acetyltransferase